MSIPAMSLEGVSAELGGRRILHNIDLTVQSGSVVGLVGPNGSGKSTLLRCAAGVLDVSAGQVRVGGGDIAELCPRERARRVAFVPQEADLPPDLLVGEYVALGRLPYAPPWSMGSASDRHALDWALDAVGLAGYAASPVAQLSGGERRRVMLARGIVQDCDVLILDEPTNHLDIRHQLELLDLLHTLGVTVVLAIHDLDMAIGHCDTLYVLCDGRIRAHGTPEVLDECVLAEVFGVHGKRLLDPDTGRAHLVFGPRPTGARRGPTVLPTHDDETERS